MFVGVFTSSVAGTEPSLTFPSAVDWALPMFPKPRPPSPILCVSLPHRLPSWQHCAKSPASGFLNRPCPGGQPGDAGPGYWHLLGEHLKGRLLGNSSHKGTALRMLSLRTEGQSQPCGQRPISDLLTTDRKSIWYFVFQMHSIA